MARITLRDAAQWCGGTVEEKYEDVVFDGAGNDTRSLQPGQLFRVVLRVLPHPDLEVGVEVDDPLLRGCIFHCGDTPCRSNGR